RWLSLGAVRAQASLGMTTTAATAMAGNDHGDRESLIASGTTIRAASIDATCQARHGAAQGGLASRSTTARGPAAAFRPPRFRGPYRLWQQHGELAIWSAHPAAQARRARPSDGPRSWVERGRADAGCHVVFLLAGKIERGSVSWDRPLPAHWHLHL